MHKVKHAQPEINRTACQKQYRWALGQRKGGHKQVLASSSWMRCFSALVVSLLRQLAETFRPRKTETWFCISEISGQITTVSPAKTTQYHPNIQYIFLGVRVHARESV